MTTEAHKTVALIVAAGSGTRAAQDGDDCPKQYQLLAAEPVIARTVRAFYDHPRVDAVQVVIREGDKPFYDSALADFADLLYPVTGGATRQESVYEGLKALDGQGVGTVLIHDAARPFVSANLISRSIDAAHDYGAAVPGMAIVDTLVQVEDDHHQAGAADRDALRATQTPQAFRFDLILHAHKQAALDGRAAFTDDGAVAAHAGHKVRIFPGQAQNVKITTHEDFLRAERELMTHLMDIRTGQGFDVHAFGDGDHVVLGGVKVPFEHGLQGHSDADVVLHALTDAILGALGDGDIGHHFPPSDEQWKGMDSAHFLHHAGTLVRARGGMIAHIDATVIGEKPKIGPFRNAMRERIAGILGIEKHRVGVKATTTEQLGFTGRREGLAALASATVRLP
jgi:2-C-methyl-D-erythritol 4-phosphate cytidylyltransferase / 2-C-methyl-D-erythritol 2,4-cyclodiphosphate synthase